MTNAPDQDILKRMGIGTVPDIVHQDRRLYAEFFFPADLYSFCLQLGHGIAHQVICAERMMQAAMHRARIDQVGECHLLDAPQALIEGMSNDVQQEVMVQRDKTIYGIIDDLT